MSKEILKILLVEDNPLGAFALKQAIEKTKEAQEIQVIHCVCMKQALDFIAKKEESIDAIILDLGLPDTVNDEESFLLAKKAAPETPIIILTGRHDIEFAQHLVTRGAQDYIEKDEVGLCPDLVLKAIKFALGRSQIQHEISEKLKEKEQTISWLSGGYSMDSTCHEAA